jgi:hypothetical protein
MRDCLAICFGFPSAEIWNENLPQKPQRRQRLLIVNFHPSVSLVAQKRLKMSFTHALCLEPHAYFYPNNERRERRLPTC